MLIAFVTFASITTIWLIILTVFTVSLSKAYNQSMNNLQDWVDELQKTLIKQQLSEILKGSVVFEKDLSPDKEDMN